MFKRLGLVFSFIILVFLITPPLTNLNGAVVSNYDKSSGNFYIIDKENYYEVLNSAGITVYKSSNFDYSRLVENLNAQLIHVFDDGNTLNLYYYSKKLPKKEIVFNKKVNLHIAITGERTVIGSPFIYYGY